MELERKIDNALNLIKRFAHRKITVYFSGGKDSLVCMDLVSKIIDRFSAVYVHITGNTHPIVDEYVHSVIDKYDVEFTELKSNRDFYSVFAEKGYPPPIRGRWCTAMFKEKVLDRFRYNVDVAVIGMKMYDSMTRKKYFDNYVSDGVAKSSHVVDIAWGTNIIYPVWNWTTEEIYEYIRRENLKLNPSYDMFGHSLNCSFCFYLTYDKMLMLKKRAYDFYCKWKNVHEKLRNGNCVGFRKTFRKFDNIYSMLENNDSIRRWM